MKKTISLKSLKSLIKETVEESISLHEGFQDHDEHGTKMYSSDEVQQANDYRTQTLRTLIEIEDAVHSIHPGSSKELLKVILEKLKEINVLLEAHS